MFVGDLFWRGNHPPFITPLMFHLARTSLRQERITTTQKGSITSVQASAEMNSGWKVFPSFAFDTPSLWVSVGLPLVSLWFPFGLPSR